jgi:acetolactate synthase-1/3 small subunit
VVIETTGAEDKIDSLVEVLRPYGVIEMVRTGRIAMVRGPRAFAREEVEHPRTAPQDGSDEAEEADNDASAGSV